MRLFLAEKQMGRASNMESVYDANKKTHISWHNTHVPLSIQTNTTIIKKTHKTCTVYRLVLQYINIKVGYLLSVIYTFAKKYFFLSVIKCIEIYWSAQSNQLFLISSIESNRIKKTVVQKDKL